jgi:hypothetical protein
MIRRLAVNAQLVREALMQPALLDVPETERARMSEIHYSGRGGMVSYCGTPSAMS